MSGEVTLANLRAECSDCNEGARDLMPLPPKYLEVMARLNPASRETKRKVYDWLRRFFGDAHDDLFAGGA